MKNGAYFLILVLILFSPCTTFAFNKTNANVMFQFARDSVWTYIYETAEAEYYIDSANSRTLSTQPLPLYQAYILSVNKKPGPILASLTLMIYTYDTRKKIYYGAVTDFRTYNSSGVIFTPRSLNKTVPEPYKLLEGTSYEIANKIYPISLKH